MATSRIYDVPNGRGFAREESRRVPAVLGPAADPLRQLHAPETDQRLAVIVGAHVAPAPSNDIDVDAICAGRFNADTDKVSVLARALGHERSPVCRVETLRALVRCAALGCPVTVACAIKHLQDNDPNVQLAAVEVLARTASKGDKNTINALLAPLMGAVAKDPTQPGEFPVAADMGSKFSLAHMPKRPGVASFGGSTALCVAAIRALAAVCVDGDLRVAACLAHMVAADRDRAVRHAAGNALVALGRAELASEAEAQARERFAFHAVHIKRAAQLHEASPSMCQLLPLGAKRR